MKRNFSSVPLALLMVMILTAVPVMSLVPALNGGGKTNRDITLGTQDAWVVGQVKNATMALDISCESIFMPSGGGSPTMVYYNGTTDTSGNFNITVDSNTWGEDENYSPIKVGLFGNYYLSPMVGKDQFFFENSTYKGNVSTVPDGLLEVVEEPLSNLTLTILNGSSGSPLPEARVELVYPQGFPEAPFSLAKGTDDSGEAVFNGIRSVNTTVDVTKLNFQPLEDTEEQDYVMVQKGGDMSVPFTLTEDPWPFSLVGDESDMNTTNNITINFNQVMDINSIIVESNYRLWKVDGGEDVEFDLEAKDGNRKAGIAPLVPLEYNTTYGVRLEPRLRSDEGTFPLWRAMELSFRTELPPGQIFGKVISSLDGSPAPQVRVQILDQVRATNETGDFHFSIVPHGTYRIDVLESFLYNDTSIRDLSIEKGELRVLDDIEIDPKPWGSMEVNVMSGDRPLEGAWVQIVDDTITEGDLNQTTDGQGRTLFSRVKTGAVIVKIGAGHHSVRDDMSLVYEGSLSYLNLSLVEDEIPVWMEASDVNDDGTVDPQTDVLIHVPEAIVFSSLNVSMWILDDEGAPLEEVELTPPEKQSELIYVINPPKLPMESDYRVVLGSELRASGSGEVILWRDVTLDMTTPDYELSYINGSLFLEGEVMEGFLVEFGPFSDLVDEEGGFNITVDLSEASMEESFNINASGYGYGSFIEELEVLPGMTYQIGDVILYHIEGWVQLVPSPGTENVAPSATVTATFLRPFVPPEVGNWSRAMSLVPEDSSAPLPGSYQVGNDNRSVTFTPGDELENNALYTIKFTEMLLQEDGNPMFPIGNRTQFKVEPPEVRLTTLAPLVEDRDSVDLDQPVVILFSFPIKRTFFEEELDILPLPAGVIFDWTSSTEVEIILYMASNTEYTLFLPIGTYGTQDEPIKSPYQLEFTTTSEYSHEHNFGSVQTSPDLEGGWETEQSIRFSGTVSDAGGWSIQLVMETGGAVVMEANATVGEDGSWSIDVVLPTQAGDYSISLTVGVPGGAAADTWTGDVAVREAGVQADDDTDEDGNTLLIAIIIIVVILLIIIAAIVYASSQRKKAQEEIDGIEYDEVESEWSDDEE